MPKPRTAEPGGVEFERDPNKVDPHIEAGMANADASRKSKKLEGNTGQSAMDGRQTDRLEDFERAQQPVTAHQDRRHK
jgi:hypothetical protein